MKNIHIIAADKPSRLFELSGDLHLHTELGFDYKRSRNIYITSNEEIKVGDYRLNIQRYYFKKVDKEGLDYYNKRNDIFKKVILSTDQDLIKDGVQAIDDDFLEWFVAHPSCEEVEVINKGKMGVFSDGTTGIIYNDYKIIIPKESPKQNLINMIEQDEELAMYEESFKHEVRVIPKEEILENRSSAYEFIDFYEKGKTNLEKLPFQELIKEFTEYYKNVTLKLQKPKQEKNCSEEEIEWKKERNFDINCS